MRTCVCVNSVISCMGLLAGYTLSLFCWQSTDLLSPISPLPQQGNMLPDSAYIHRESSSIFCDLRDLRGGCKEL